MLEKIRSFRNRSVPLPKGALPELHEISPAEQKLRSAMSRYDESWLADMGYPREASEWGDCNIGPDMIGHVVLDEARRHGFSATSKRYQLRRVHEAAGGSFEDAFQHAFNIVNIDDEAFLVDTTFAQFFGENGLIGDGAREYREKVNSGVSNDNPLAVALKIDGYVPLTPENFKEYLRITSKSPHREYTDTADPVLLGEVPELEAEFTHADAIKRGYDLLPFPPEQPH